MSRLRPRAIHLAYPFGPKFETILRRLSLAVRSHVYCSSSQNWPLNEAPGEVLRPCDRRRRRGLQGQNGNSLRRRRWWRWRVQSCYTHIDINFSPICVLPDWCAFDAPGNGNISIFFFFPFFRLTSARHDLLLCWGDFWLWPCPRQRPNPGKRIPFFRETSDVSGVQRGRERERERETAATGRNNSRSSIFCFFGANQEKNPSFSEAKNAAIRGLQTSPPL